MSSTPSPQPETLDPDIGRILALVKAASGVDFSQYRDSTIGRRIQRRAATLLPSPVSLADYGDLLERNPGEVQALYHDLLINVTSFFRDPGLFEALKGSVFPAILAAKAPDAPVRIWVPGCSTGQEVYSLAIAWLEYCDTAPRPLALQLFGTDLTDETTLNKARAGRYPAGIEAEVSAERLARFFGRDGDEYVVRRELRGLCVFARHDVTSDPPFSRIDLLSCRNVLIYMAPLLQQRVLPVFHYALNIPGYLVLGPSEATGGSELFEPVQRAERIYAKRPAAAPTIPQVPHAFMGRAPAPGRALAPPAFPSPPPAPPRLKGWRRLLRPGSTARADALALQQELAAAKEFQQTLAEQYEAANEELRSANEEILSSNEELQSSNEELRAAKEELQSANEELSAVNTQLAQRHAELSELHSDLANLLESLALPVVMVGPDLRIRRFTAPAGALLNLNARDLGAPFEQLQPALGLSNLAALVARVIETRQPLERSVAGPDGRWYALRLHPAQGGANARTEGALIVLLDITELRRGEEAHARLAAIVQSSEDAIIGKSLDGTITSWNRGAERLYGYTADEIIGLPISVLIPLGHLDELPGIMERLRRGERIEPFETLRRRKDGRVVQISLGVSPLLDPAGQVIGASAIARDITASRQAAEALRQSESRKAAILQTALDAMITIDHRGRVLEFNPAAERMFGFREGEVLGKPLAELIIPPGYREQHISGLARYLQTGAGPVLNRRIELTALRADGSEFPVELSITRIGPEEPPVFTSALRDITERKRAEHELHEASRRKDEFLAVLSHELRNPLAPIRGALEIMRIKPPADREQREARDMIERQVTQMVRLVDDLLDISRVTQGRIELRTEPLELATVLFSALESTRHAIEQGGQELSVTLPSEPVRLIADPVRLAQVLLNLLHNAAKFTPAGGRITVSATLDAGEAVIAVRDTGVGIPADSLEKIFELFTQGERSTAQSHSGLGVGLTLVRSLVELHGGSVVARSEGPDRGSEFLVRLPLAPAGTPVPASAARPEPQASRAARQRKRILVVDDNVDQARSLEMLLRLEGHDVRVAHDGAGALGTLDGFHPEVALLDIGLPGMNGYELAQRLRAELPQVILIAQTGWGQDEDRARTQAAGFDHHLTKPVELEQLNQLIG